MATALFVLLVFSFAPFVFCSRFCWAKPILRLEVQRGWFNFFRNGNSLSAFATLDKWLRRRLRSLLRRRHRRRGISRGGNDHRRWPNSSFVRHGFFSLTDHLDVFRRTPRQLGLF